MIYGAPTRHDGCQPQWNTANRANLGTGKWELAPAGKNALEWCDCGSRGREQGAPNEAKSGPSSPFCLCCHSHELSSPRTLSQPRASPSSYRTETQKVKGTKADGTAQGQSDCICVGKEWRGNHGMNHTLADLADGLEATGGFPVPRNLSASRMRKLRHSLEYSKLWPERRLVSPQTRGNYG